MGAWEGMISAESGIASRCAVSGTDSMAEWSQLSDIDSSDSGESGGREGRKSILEFGGIGRERRCEGHQSGKERKRKGPFVRRKREREREEGSDCFKDGSARVEREKRKVAAVSRFDSAMFPDSSRGTKGEAGERRTTTRSESAERDRRRERKGMEWRAARLGGSKGASPLPAPHSAHPLFPSSLS